LQSALQLGMGSRVSIETPLMWLDKVATWQLADQLGGEALIDLIRTETHTCYLGERSQLRAWGYGCGHCPACELRMNGYQHFKAT
ncbi:MAG: 7-cyano-7-deazaguanine synthase, partial [Betaproteobacteria bacterium]